MPVLSVLKYRHTQLPNNLARRVQSVKKKITRDITTMPVLTVLKSRPTQFPNNVARRAQSVKKQ